MSPRRATDMRKAGGGLKLLNFGTSWHLGQVNLASLKRRGAQDLHRFSPSSTIAIFQRAPAYTKLVFK